MNDAQKLLGFDVGDSVSVKPGTIDPDLGIDIGGSQGRVTDIQLSNDGVAMVEIRWDSITLQNTPDSVFVQCEDMGLGWTDYILEAEEVEKTTPRDTEADVARIVAVLSTRFAWSYLGEQGKRIGQVMAGVDRKDIMAALRVWQTYLAKHLCFPFEAQVDEYQSKGLFQAGDRVKATGIALVDDLYGVIVDLRRGRRKYAFPLCDLGVMDECSPNHQIVEDYQTWFANR